MICSGEVNLKKIEIRAPLDYHPSRKKIQFYINSPFKVLLTLQQSKDSDEICVLGKDLLCAFSNSEEKGEIFFYIVGITKDDDLFIFEPHQDLIPIQRDMVLKFKGVKKSEKS